MSAPPSAERERTALEQALTHRAADAMNSVNDETREANQVKRGASA